MTASSEERWLRVVRALGAYDGTELTLPGMCTAAASLLRAAGVAILVMADGVPGATFASHPLAEALEDLQFTLGAGPRVDAWTMGVPVAAMDLAEGSATGWVGFCGPALAAGARSVHSFPLRVGAARLGVLTVYRHRSGPLDADVYADTVVIADVVTRFLLATRTSLAAEDLVSAFSDEELGAEVHQASGMVSVQLGISVGDALARLRARAFAHGITLAAVAREVVAGSLRLDDA